MAYILKFLIFILITNSAVAGLNCSKLFQKITGKNKVSIEDLLEKIKKDPESIVFDDYSQISHLSDDHLLKLVVTRLNRQGTRFSLEYLDDFFKKHTPQGVSKQAALSAFYHMSSLSNTKDLSHFLKQIKSKFITGILPYFDFPEINSTFTYLSKKLLDFPLSSYGFDEIEIENRKIFYFIDSVTLNYLESHPHKLKKIMGNNNDLKIVLIDDFEENINIFDLYNEEKMIKRFQELALHIEGKSQLKKTKTQDIKKRLKKLGLDKYILTIHFNQLTKQVEEGERSYELLDHITHEKILSLITPKQVSEKDFENRFKYKVAPKFRREYLLSFLSQAQYLSLQRMSSMLNDVMKKFEKHNNLDDTLFYLNRETKSYTMLYWMLLRNDDRKLNIVNLSTAKNLEISKNINSVAIVDDFVGSGVTATGLLASASKHLLDNNTHIISDLQQKVVSLIDTNTAKYYQSSSDRKKEWYSVFTADKFHETKLYESYRYHAPEGNSIAQNTWFGGYGQTGSMVIMEYMSPDNNIEIFRGPHGLAELFLENKKAAK